MGKYSEWMTKSCVERAPLWMDKWAYDYGVVLKGVEEVYNDTGNDLFAAYILNNMSRFINDDGSIKGYSPDEFNIDHINNGKLLFFCHKKTGDAQYLKAAKTLIGQVKKHPRTSENVLWHKKVYPYQIWLDGLYMASPFWAQYIAESGEGGAFDEVLQQFLVCEKHTKCRDTGLLFHAYDETKSLYWCDPATGLSPHFWARAIGWFVMALNDVLDYLPKDHKDRQTLVDMLDRTLAPLLKVQDATGVWWQILNLPEQKGNYLEASASCMYLYGMAKGVLKGYLEKDKYLPSIKKAYNGIIAEFVTETGLGHLNLNKVCQSAGLGNHPDIEDKGRRRDGSFAYYISEPIVTNDPKGIGAFIKAYAYAERLLGE